MPLPMSARSNATEERYQEAKLNGECIDLGEEPAIWESLFWRIIINRFPPDAFYKTERSRMLLPKRKVSDWWKLFPWEAIELIVILYKRRFDGSQITLNLGDTRSVPGHLHFHFNDFYDKREDIRL